MKTKEIHPPFPEAQNCICGHRLPCPGFHDYDEIDPIDDVAESSLDPLEISGKDQRCADGEQFPTYASPAEKLDQGEPSPATAFRHSGWMPLRRRVQAALVRAGTPVDRRIRFMNCGSTYHVLESKAQPGTFKLAANACHDKFCLPCANERSRIIANNVRAFLPGYDVRFVTLTIRSTDEPLAELLETLYNAFKALRKLPIWSKTQTGGVAFLEVKWSAKTNRWHPHFHVLTQGKFIDQAKLSIAWKAVTHGSWVCDVRAIKDQDHALNYCTKYASKPFTRDMLTTPDRLDEAIHALSGRRTVLTFGKWKGLRVTAQPKKDEWEHVGTVASLASKAVTGDKRSMQILILTLKEHAIPFLKHAEQAEIWQHPTSINWPTQHFVARHPWQAEYDDAQRNLALAR